MQRLLVIAASAAGMAAIGATLLARPAESPAQEGKVFELRTYTPAPGKMDALLARFRNHTVKLFAKHGMTNVGYWVTVEPVEGEKRLIYLLAHKSREAAAASWRAFIADPEWNRAREESEREGRLAVKVESVYLTATDFSRIR